MEHLGVDDPYGLVFFTPTNYSNVYDHLLGRVWSTPKIITIRLSDVEAAMLVEVLRSSKVFNGLQHLLIQQIRQKYQKPSGGSGR